MINIETIDIKYKDSNNDLMHLEKGLKFSRQINTCCLPWTSDKAIFYYSFHDDFFRCESIIYYQDKINNKEIAILLVLNKFI